ncbi:MAG: hypothetical protein WA843_01315 [Candidatus Saccharimonadales bacterium]
MKYVMTQGFAKRRHGCLVVLDPKVPREPKYKESSVDPEHPFKELVLFEYTWGQETDWEHDYRKVARAKAFASWKTGLPTRLINQSAPYLYEPGFTKWPGSAVGPGGLVVAFSGVEDYFDEMFSEIMLAIIKGLCMHEVHGPGGVMADSDITFLGV